MLCMIEQILFYELCLYIHCTIRIYNTLLISLRTISRGDVQRLDEDGLAAFPGRQRIHCDTCSESFICG